MVAWLEHRANYNFLTSTKFIEKYTNTYTIKSISQNYAYIWIDSALDAYKLIKYIFVCLTTKPKRTYNLERHRIVKREKVDVASG